MQPGVGLGSMLAESRKIMRLIIGSDVDFEAGIKFTPILIFFNIILKLELEKDCGQLKVNETLEEFHPNGSKLK